MNNKFFRFASVNFSDSIAYEFDYDNWDYRNRDYAVADCIKQYDTYGDGMTPHSPSHAVAKENFADVCISLAKHILESGVGNEQFDVVVRQLGTDLSTQDFEFFSKVKFNQEKYDAGKTEYVNLQERKKSSADSKRHDKRWIQVAEWMNGETESIYRLVCEKHNITQFIDRFAAYCEIQDWTSTQDKLWRGEDVADFFGIKGGEDWTDTKQNKSAWHALASVRDSHRSIQSARRSIQCYDSNTERYREQAKEKTEA